MHKPKGQVSTDLNRPCNDADTDCLDGEECEVTATDSRLHFGNSTDACEENYFTFKHAYTCVPTNSSWNKCNISSGEPENGDYYCWDIKTQTCHFKPRIQILDNWGWCNGVSNAKVLDRTYQAYWNDWDPNGTVLEEYKRKCSLDYTDSAKGKTQWTYFPGILELKP